MISRSYQKKLYRIRKSASAVKLCFFYFVLFAPDLDDLFFDAPCLGCRVGGTADASAEDEGIDIDTLEQVEFVVADRTGGTDFDVIFRELLQDGELIGCPGPRQVAGVLQGQLIDPAFQPYRDVIEGPVVRSILWLHQGYSRLQSPLGRFRRFIQHIQADHHCTFQQVRYRHNDPRHLCRPVHPSADPSARS